MGLFLADDRPGCHHPPVIEAAQLTPAVVRLLRAFADSTFEMRTLVDLAARVGVESRISDPWLTCFDLPGGVVLQLAAEDEQGDRVGAAIASLCGWDTGAAKELTTHTERATYDALYDQALDIVTSTIGAPDVNAADEGRFPFQWSAWFGESGLMALQQSHYDYCPDINVWVRARPEGQFLPSQPFVNWLMTAP